MLQLTRKAMSQNYVTSMQEKRVKAYISLTGENSFSRSCESNISKPIAALIKA